MQKIISHLLLLFSTLYWPPIICALIYEEYHSVHVFLISWMASLLAGIFLRFQTKKQAFSLSSQSSNILACSMWFILSFMVTLPFLIDGRMSVPNAFFESLSGLTTTGATVITDLTQWSYSFLFYRQFLQWVGGIGIVLLMVAVLPMLGSNGSHLYRTEITGIDKDQKLTPKIASTAKLLLFTYIFLTIACAFSYYLAGMNKFEALTHAFSTVSIGGFSIYNENLGHFQSQSIEIIAVVFILISSINFGLHILFLQTGKLTHYFRNKELRHFFYMIIFCVLMVVYTAYKFPSTHSLGNAIFQGISVITTAGFTLDSLESYPIFLQSFWLILACVGGCAGSLSGGIKMIRCWVILKHIKHEVQRFLHPNILLRFKINNKYLSTNIISSLFCFLIIYLLLIIISYCALVFFGLDSKTALSATLASINNLGPGLGGVAVNYAQLPDVPKFILIFLMLAGRLEIMIFFSFFALRSSW